MLNSARRLILLALFSVALIVPVSTAYGVPANDEVQTLTQPDGTVVSAQLHGDESLNWFETTDGAVIVQDTTKTWRFTEKKNPRKAIANLKPGKDRKPSNAASGSDMVALSSSALVPSESTVGIGDASTVLQAAAAPGTPTSRPLMVIMVEFSNYSFSTDEAFWSNRFFGTSGKTVHTYYNEVSKGRFDFTPAAEYGGTYNNGVIRVRIATPHPDSRTASDPDIQQAVIDAVKAASNYVDFYAYDTNKNGLITNNELQIYTVFAGYESSTQNVSPQVWAHAWATSGVLADGVKLAGGGANSSYAVQGELMGAGVPLSIGVATHELGHALGLPDLYDYGYDSMGVGDHSLMAKGNWGYVSGEKHGTTPVHMDAYCKWLLGFGDAQVVTGTSSTTLQSASSAGYSMMIVPALGSTYSSTVPKTGEWFFVENRQFTGFDAGLQQSMAAGAKGGLLVTHVDWAQIAKAPMSPNEDETHKGVDVEESNLGTLGYAQLDQAAGSQFDHYFYADWGHVSVFGPSTVPNSAMYSGTASGITISTPSASSASMQVNVTTPGSNLPTVQAIAGNSLYDTAVAISKSAYPTGLPTTGARTVVLSTGLGWSDALAGSSLAGALDGPILLTEPASLPYSVKSEIARLKATKVIVLGGRFAVSDAVLDSIRAISGVVSVERIGGTTMYDTADLIAQRTIKELNGSWAGTVVFATGVTYPDAIAVSPFAARNHMPIFLIDPANGLSDGAQTLLSGTSVKKAIVLGGKYAVPTAVEDQLATDLGASNVTRLWGNTSYDTAAEIAKYGISISGGTIGWDQAAIATGENFPDALAGGVLQAKRSSVLLLTPSNALAESTRAILAANKASIDNITYLGGIYAITQPVRDQVAFSLAK